jgi:hypothetical protein
MKSNTVIAIALLGILANSSINTYLGIEKAEMEMTTQRQEKIVQVVGRYHAFDGYSSKPGFIIVNDGKLEIARVDIGSIARVSTRTPQYLVKYGVGSYYPINVETETAIPTNTR